MPYINQETRKALNLGMVPMTPGELNYCMTMFCKAYVSTKGLSYQTIAEITGVLENVKQEFYRRVAVPYEEAKMEENGDVYSPEMLP